MCLVPCYLWPSNFMAFLIVRESWCTSTKPSALWDQDSKCNYCDILCVVSTISFNKKQTQNVRQLCCLRVWQWDYFGSTLRQIALCMIQFATAVFSENSLRTLEFSILVEMLHNNFGHNTDYVIFPGALFCSMPSSNCFAWLAEGQVSSILNNVHVVKWNCTPSCSHKICT